MKRDREDHFGNRGPDMTCGIGQAKEIYNIVDTASDVASKLGVVPSSRPVLDEVHISIFPGTVPGTYFDGRMPTVMRRLSIDQLSHLHNLMQSWYTYLSSQAAMWKIRCSQLEQISDVTKACLRELYKNEGHTDQGAKDMALHDIRYAQDNAESEKAKAVHTLIDAALRSAGRNIDLIIQELITRGVEIKATNRRAGRWDASEPTIPPTYIEANDAATAQPGVKGPTTARRSRWG